MMMRIRMMLSIMTMVMIITNIDCDIYFDSGGRFYHLGR